MQETSTSPTPILQFRQDIEAQFRRHIREALAVALAEELAAALGSGRHQRTDRRCGYRNGTVERTITTPDGTRTVTVPRGRVADTAGVTTEFHSQLLPRYARRTREIDDAILGCYLGGINSRRIRIALKPLLGERHLSKSAVSRIVGRLKGLFTRWQGRDLSAARYPIVFLDGFHLNVRVARRVVSVPVLAALGVTETGQKCLLTLRLAASEAAATWSAVVTDLQQRGLAAPLLLVVDGNPAYRAMVTVTGGRFVAPEIGLPMKGHRHGRHPSGTTSETRVSGADARAVWAGQPRSEGSVAG